MAAVRMPIVRMGAVEWCLVVVYLVGSMKVSCLPFGEFQKPDGISLTGIQENPDNGGSKSTPATTHQGSFVVTDMANDLGEGPTGSATTTTAGEGPTGSATTTTAGEGPTGSATTTTAGEGPTGSATTTTAGEGPTGSATTTTAGEELL
ncbi:polysialoglycoprotein-like [Esox lucius]|uniref:polysialoglycoprotein-like n=1 Tax=Esox lucius TaxID=8010 RepID=UPI001476EA38|nr:polysialoglycoprotein-like [Esox lucius]